VSKLSRAVASDLTGFQVGDLVEFVDPEMGKNCDCVACHAMRKFGAATVAGAGNGRVVIIEGGKTYRYEASLFKLVVEP